MMAFRAGSSVYRARRLPFTCQPVMRRRMVAVLEYERESKAQMERVRWMERSARECFPLR